MASFTDFLTGKEAMGLVKPLEGVFKGFPHLPTAKGNHHIDC